MGYDLHITRAMNWLDAENHPIGREEWRKYARRHPAMVEDGWIEWADIGREPCYAWPSHGVEPNSLSWRGGEVVVTGAVDDLAELVAIAESLGANLLGDGNERYTRGMCFRLRDVE
jgi:hypothetical protein